MLLTLLLTLRACGAKEASGQIAPDSNADAAMSSNLARKRKANRMKNGRKAVQGAKMDMSALANYTIKVR